MAEAGGTSLEPPPGEWRSDQILAHEEPMTVRALITGLGENELPGHTQKLLALIP